MKPTFVNPESKFVVVTYWWGRGNLNRNTQRPCPEDITDAIKENFAEELVEKDEEFADLHKRFLAARDVCRKAGKTATPKQGVAFRDLRALRDWYLSNYFKRPDILAALRAATKPYEDELLEAGKFKAPIRFEEMIKNWENACAAAKCSHMAVEYPQFAKPGGYQLAINAKPLFIRKALNVLEGRGALYIDGDMLINKYPAIFDMPNVDFMARGWNADPRSAARKYKTDVCFDPYIFETSGGTMYFANTPASKALLADWHKESGKPVNKGKADDRILSLIFTAKRYISRTNTIQLPIEYLWLGEIYNGVVAAEDMSKGDIYIEHPECLTGEERATEQSVDTLTNSRQPKFYGRLVEDQVECARRGGVFYEYVFFPTKEMVSAFAPYLNYMRNAKHHETNLPLFEVVSFDETYGRYRTIVLKNTEAAKTVEISVPPATLQIKTPPLTSPQVKTPRLTSPQVKTPRLATPQVKTPRLATPQVKTPRPATPQPQTDTRPAWRRGGAPTATQIGPTGIPLQRLVPTTATQKPILPTRRPSPVTLPLNASIPTILAHLLKGVDVKLGAVGQIPPLTECMVTNNDTEEPDAKTLYNQRIVVDITRPMFFSATNRILIQLISMCETMADINTHLKESYVFMSRIRWSFAR